MTNVNKPARNNCSARVFLFSMPLSPMIQNKGNAAKQIAAFPFQPSDHLRYISGLFRSRPEA